MANGGEPLSGPKILPDGDLLLEYVDGEMCVDSDNSSKTDNRCIGSLALLS